MIWAVGSFCVLIAVVAVEAQPPVRVGLLSNYYDNSVVGGDPPFMFRLDPNIDFDFNPPPLIQPVYSIEWNALLTPQDSSQTGTCQFAVTVDEEAGVLMWLDSHILFDEWANFTSGLRVPQALRNPQRTRPHPNGGAAPPLITALANITLSLGQSYAFRMQYFHFSNASFGIIQLYWSCTGSGSGSGDSSSEEDDDVLPPPTIVPPEVFTAVISDSEQKRQDLRRSLANGWGEWWDYNMLASVYLPHSFGFDSGIVQLSTQLHLQYTMPNTVNPAPVTMHVGGREYPTAGYNGLNEITSFVWQNLTLRYQSCNGNLSTATAATEEDVELSDSDEVDDYVWLLSVLPSIDQDTSSEVVGVNVSDFVFVVHPAFFWSGSGTVTRYERNVTFVPNGLEETLSLHFDPKCLATRSIPLPPTVPSGALIFNLSACGRSDSKQIGLSTRVSRSIGNITRLIYTAKEQHNARRMIYGEDAELYNAMQSALSHNTIWTPQDGVVTPVARGWSLGAADDYILFDWDNYFVSLMFSTDHKELSFNNIIAITKSKSLNGGFIPNFAAGGMKSDDRTEPYVGSLVLDWILAHYQYNEEDMWLAELLFHDLMDWNDWVWRERKVDPLGLIVLGSDMHQSDNSSAMQNARFESGLDNSPMYDSPPVFYNMTSNRMQLYDVGMSALYLSDTLRLQSIAKRLGLNNESSILGDRANSIHDALQANCWNDTIGVYVNLLRESAGNGSYVRLSPTLFYPMLSGLVLDSAAKRMISDHLLNPNEFCIGGGGENGCWSVPSIAKSDPAFNDQNYWRGRVWGPMNFLIYASLKQYPHLDIANEARQLLCADSRQLLLYEWLKFSHVHENYNGISGMGHDVSNSDPLYTWGALLGFISLVEHGHY